MINQDKYYVSGADVIQTGDGETEILPSEYCLRDDYIIMAQNQDVHGYCWNFASTMATTTAIMKATNEYYDFSELWVGLSAYNCSNYSGVGKGGSFSTQYNALKTSGLMLESDLPYENGYTMSNENAESYYNFYNKYSNDDLASCVVYDSSMSYSRKNIEQIKKHIYEKSSIYMAFSFKTGFIDDGKGGHYLTPNQKNTNSSHAVSVIGWDDNYQREFYLDGSDTPTVFKGVWIILNSYTETSGKDGISFVFYDDNNISSVQGYRYEPNTNKDLYFYDKIEEGYAYPTSVIGKYYGNYETKTGVTKQKNIFYDNVNLKYSYNVSTGADMKDIKIYLNNNDVTNNFTINIDKNLKHFNISKKDADYGQYKVLITYGNDEKTDTYLNNFYVTHGLIGESIEYDSSNNDLGFNTGSDLEFYSFISTEKNYVIYTNKQTGSVSFLPRTPSVYSEKDMSIPTISYEITNDNNYVGKYTIISNSGYELDYTFNFEYYEDTSLQSVFVYYDLGGGVNNLKNYSMELASEVSDLMLYEPTRDGYTFAGWYLDYGSGSKKISSSKGVYYIDWDDIIHIGESPTMFAKSHYKKYYNNSNIVFVYAHWEEEKYYDINLSLSGNGSSQIGEKITVSSNDSVRYLFTPNSGWCLSNVKINGNSVSSKKLIEISKYGLFLENIEDNISIEATFSEGTYLILNLGENIKTAYLTRATNGLIQNNKKELFDLANKTNNLIQNFEKEFLQIEAYNLVEKEKFYDGDFITWTTERPLVYTAFFSLVVEVFDDTDTYTYLLENINGYNIIEKGVFSKTITISRNTKYVELDIGSAVEKEIKNVNVNYSVGNHISDHYLSADKNATSGSKWSETISLGEVIYLFVKLPRQTNAYSYSAPSGFERFGIDWYRKAFYVNSENLDLGTIQGYREVQEYKVTGNNWDGKVIYYDYYEYGTVPVFYNEDDDGKNQYPTRPDDEKYTYTFVGWTPIVEEVRGTCVYTAVFTQTPKKYTITIEQTGKGTIITPSEDNTITFFDKHTYIFIPDNGYKIKDIKIDGVSIGLVESYTFENVVKNHIISVEYEILKFNISVKFEGMGGVSSSDTFDEVSFGESRTLTITPQDGWLVASVFVNGQKTTFQGSRLSLDNITENFDVIVFFKEKNIDRITLDKQNNTGFIVVISIVSVIALISTTLLVVLIIKCSKNNIKIFNNKSTNKKR
ncbi:MAG: InlB B-repeat-containing protein [Clostridia bacterium]|nr:InlB B-repeat-containing protein [Clostridia bacterium]